MFTRSISPSNLNAKGGMVELRYSEKALRGVCGFCIGTSKGLTALSKHSRLVSRYLSEMV
ncbi:MAG: hypothetical protein ACI88A_000918 [Paraglaciecola sp.]|jgi:hypothetical protein